MPVVFLILPTRLLSGDNKRVNAWWIQAESLSLWVLCWCARLPVLWLTSVLHSASYSLHMSSTAPFSIQANVTGGWLHSHMPRRVWPAGWAALCECATSVIGSRPHETLVSLTGHTEPRRHTVSDMCASASRCCVSHRSSQEHHRHLPLRCSTYSLTCTLARARQPLRLLWQTETEIAPQIDPSSGSQGTSSPTSVRCCLGPKQVILKPQGNQIWN